MPAPLSSVLLVPGQGSYHGPTTQRLAREHGLVRETFAEIDDAVVGVGETPVSGVLLDGAPPPPDELSAHRPDALHLAIFGTSVALHRLAAAAGYRPDAVVGHSFGEIGALVVGGGLSLAEGAQVVAHRNAALRRTGARDGSMLALACSAERAEHLLGALGDPWTAVAVENGPRQTVVSGPRDSLDALATMAGALRVAATPLPVPYPFHSPLLADAVADVAARIASLRVRPLTTPVMSPVLGRWYSVEDDVAAHLARALVVRVRFAHALRALSDAGIARVVEAGGATPLSRLVQQVLPAAQVRSAADLAADLATGATPRDGAPPSSGAPVTPGLPPRAPAAAAVPAPRRPEAAAAGTAAAGTAAGTAPPATRAALFAEIAAMYAEALEYPVEVFTEDVALEADLGIDSVKQTELLARAADRYGLPATRPDDFRLADHDTLGAVVDYLESQRPGVPAAASEQDDDGREPAPPDRPQVLTAVDGIGDMGTPARPDGAAVAAPPATRAALFAEIAAMYAEALEYPVEVFTEDVALEADLGIDSVKQTELLARAADRYGLPATRPDDFRLADHDTLGAVVDYLESQRPGVAADAAVTAVAA